MADASVLTRVVPKAKPVVIDTNVVLDLLVFADPSVQGLAAALAQGQLHWLATTAMRDEFQRVLDYPAVSVALAARHLQAQDLLARFDHCCVMHAAAPPCAIRCGDADDQPFIDLAAAHRAMLLSKDKQVLRLHRRMAAIGVAVQPHFRQQPA